MVDIDRQKATIYTGNYDFFTMASRAAWTRRARRTAAGEARAAETEDLHRALQRQRQHREAGTGRYKMLDKLSEEMEEILRARASTRAFFDLKRAKTSAGSRRDPRLTKSFDGKSSSRT